MNILIAMTLMALCTGALATLLDQVWYARATVQLLHQQMIKEYEQERKCAYEKALTAQLQKDAQKKPR
jgi:uncharacterized membrane protein (DUF106 family)